MNNRPTIFIGSSVNGLRYAEAIQQNLEYDAECIIWNQGIFGLSDGTLEALVRSLDDYDFAILVCTPDDVQLLSDGAKRAIPRDNVLFELGLFIGRLGKERTFIVVDRAAAIKLPTDLAGITPATFQPPSALGNTQSALGSASTSIKAVLQRLKRRHPENSIQVTVGIFQDRYGTGPSVKISNRGNEDFPPYKLVLYIPNEGGLEIFDSDKSGILLPEQTRKHVAVFKRGDMGEKFVTDVFSRMKSLEGCTLHLILEDSEKVLCEDSRAAFNIISTLMDLFEFKPSFEVLKHY